MESRLRVLNFQELNKKEQLILLAGIFEGEGWFGINKRKYGWTPSAVMEIQMTDEEIVTKFKEYLKAEAPIYKRKKKEKDYHKDVYRFTIKGHRALHFMEEMLPYLGIRRREQYYAVVKSIGDGPKNWSPPICQSSKDETSNVGRTINARRKNASGRDRVRGQAIRS